MQTDDMMEVQRQKTWRMAWFINAIRMVVLVHLPALRRKMAGIRIGDDAASVRVCVRACGRARVRACGRACVG